MRSQPLVSVIIAFRDTLPSFMREAIDSVVQQTYRNWELWLVDDGSREASASVAMEYAARDPERIRYLTHPGHQHLGASATRQLGIQHARGEFVALLDADDMWLPQKLTEQVVLLRAQPNVGMLYGTTLYWHSWTGRDEDASRDYVPRLGVPPGRTFEPPILLRMFLEGRAAVPCTCSVLARRDVIAKTGGFEAMFHGVVDDQVFYAKMCLAAPVLVSGECWDRYRQHEASSTSLAARDGELQAEYYGYLKWLQEYMRTRRIVDRGLRRALQRQLWLHARLAGSESREFAGQRAQRIRKWVLRLEARLLPLRLRDWLWLRERPQ
jgi:glycosyltransferase involved in cell wall biosynthesis